LTWGVRGEYPYISQTTLAKAISDQKYPHYSDVLVEKLAIIVRLKLPFTINVYSGWKCTVITESSLF
jgi:hypothetical protein